MFRDMLDRGTNLETEVKDGYRRNKVDETSVSEKQVV